MNPLLMALMQRAGMGGGGPPMQPVQTGGMQAQPPRPMPQVAHVAPGITGGAQPPGVLPTPAPAPNPQPSLPAPVASVGPGDTSAPAFSQPARGGVGQGPNGLMPARQGDMFNPPFTGAEPTTGPAGISPPVNNFGRSPLGALLMPQNIQTMMQRLPQAGPSSGGSGFI
jgi:hypothetical protein